MKIFSILSALGSALSQCDDEVFGRDIWRQDPLSHPDLEAMSLRELADLPFNRGTRSIRIADPCGCR
jgi:hypothetical protein